MSCQDQQKVEVRLVLHTPRLAKAQAFYSAIGMRWIAGREQEILENFRPDGPADVMGLPFLLGDLGNVEFSFYFQKEPASASDPGTEIFVRLPEVGDATRIIEKLKSASAFVPAADFDKFNTTVIDPDGRRVILCDPNPFT